MNFFRGGEDEERQGCEKTETEWGRDRNGGEGLGGKSKLTALGALWFSNFPSLPVSFSIAAIARECG